MPDYNNSKIYRIKSKSTNQSYIGSTTEHYLSKRLSKHLDAFKQYQKNYEKYRYTTSFKILECGDYEIELIVNFSCANKQQLEKEEGKYIKLEKEENKYICVNQVIAGRTRQEYNEDKKEILKEKNKKYKEEHKKEIAEQTKKYREEHKEHTKEIWQKYYAENKEKLAEKKKIKREKEEKIKCDICSNEVTKNHLKRHQQSQKCKSVANN